MLSVHYCTLYSEHYCTVLSVHYCTLYSDHYCTVLTVNITVQCLVYITVHFTVNITVQFLVYITVQHCSELSCAKFCCNILHYVTDASLKPKNYCCKKCNKKVIIFHSQILVREGFKKTIESVIMIIPGWTHPPLFWELWSPLGFFFRDIFRLIGWFRSCLETHFGYV